MQMKHSLCAKETEFYSNENMYKNNCRNYRIQAIAFQQATTF